ncbi:N-acetylmuramoyl-L-alanine amidase [Neobacillus niacini]|uniref:N-acetylmuramoyl-L-alanine amidase n=1 Tax=Neobacillus niacini TaxID=86668 RepID=UPI002FFDB70D
MVKIALSAGHGPDTPGKRSPDGFREFQFNYPTAEFVVDYLNEYENVSILRVYEKTRDVPLAERTTKANNWKADIYISIHYNAAGPGGWYDAAHGIETIVYSKSSSNTGFKVASQIQPKLIAATGLRDRGVKAMPGLWEMRKTNMGAALAECGFMTNRNEKALMMKTSYQQKCARAIVDGIVARYGLKRKSGTAPKPSPTPSKPSTGKLFRVQVGAFGSSANANRFLAKVKASGYKDAWIKTSNGLHRIQVGAFSKHENAQNLVNELKKKGYNDAWITN